MGQGQIHVCMGNRGLDEDKAQADILQTTPPTPGWDMCDTPQRVSNGLNVNALLERKTSFNLTMARPPVSWRSSLAYGNP